MHLSSIVLDDPECVLVDNGPRSVAYFCQKKPVRVDAELIPTLKRLAAEFGGKNVRLCLHESPDALFHDMLILEHRANYYRPHKHLAKGESYHVIEGSLAAFVFDDRGSVIDACVLEPHGNLMYRIAAEMYHSVMPLTDIVIYHEAKPGPFLGASDAVYPSWSLDGTDAEEVQKFRMRLYGALNLR